MADGTRIKSFEDSIRKVEALLQQLQQTKALIQGIEDPNQKFEFKALPESFTAVANLALSDSGVKIIDGHAAKDVLIEEISESGIVKKDESKIPLDEDAAEPYSDGEFPNLSVGLLSSSMELLIASSNVSEQVVAKAELLIDGTFISKNSTEMMTNSYAYKVFDERMDEKIVLFGFSLDQFESFGGRLRTSHEYAYKCLEEMPKNVVGVLTGLGYRRFSMSMEKICAEVVIDRCSNPFIFDPGIPNFGRQVSVFECLLSSHVNGFDSEVWVNHCFESTKHDSTTWSFDRGVPEYDSIDGVVTYGLKFIKGNPSSMPFDRGRACIEGTLQTQDAF